LWLLAVINSPQNRCKDITCAPRRVLKSELYSFKEEAGFARRPMLTSLAEMPAELRQVQRQHFGMVQWSRCLTLTRESESGVEYFDSVGLLLASTN
jgi:hypothetical protein